ncbi:MAG: GAF domain-containing sensor histidine kinase [Ardenticatenaceae bacterium]|nr:GAF domain-containing sensor histidine kinase [Ardenticatenaceae bacterium]MCB9444552.1 GAF domain-containing sensor histidine kinase [Ardenticatenaceae bacterium]
MGNGSEQDHQTIDEKAITTCLLQGANRVLVETRRCKSVLAYLLQETAVHLDVEGCLLWLFEEELTDTLVCKAAYPDPLANLHHYPLLPLGIGVVGQVAQTGEAQLAADEFADQFLALDIQAITAIPIHSLLAVSIPDEKSPMGALLVLNKKDGFASEDIQTAEAVAAAFGIAINNAQLVESLHKQTIDLEERNEDLDAFAHSVAHDLQNPLSRIVGFAELLKFKYEDLSTKDRQYVADSLRTDATKMSSIIQELLLLASVRKTEIPIKPLSMQEVVNHALARISHLVKQYNAELILPEQWHNAMGYGPWVEEVWENYVSNALKYGGQPPRVELGSTPLRNGTVRFWVKDNGQGFSVEEQSQLFVPFSKLEKKSQNGNGKSSGLGLSIVRRIIEKLGGRVNATSIEGQGSVFSFTLPGTEEKWEE